jgi:hypothetical protein
VERVEAPGMARWLDIPPAPGIYVVFLPPGVPFDVRHSAGTAARASPAPVADLREKWKRINRGTPTDILYIGKGNDVRKRVRSLARFGAGKIRTHKGGEWMWQVTQIRSARILVQVCPPGRQIPFEKWLLDLFFNQHGDWPLANRQGGQGSEVWSPSSP